MKKSKFLNILISVCLLQCCVFATEPDVMSVEQNQQVTEALQTEQNTENLNTDVQPVASEESVNLQNQDDLQNVYKKPLSKRKIAKKFLLAMLGVAVSSFLIFFVLSVYNKIRNNITNTVKTPEGETSLKTPEDIEEAVKTFLQKTDWKG